MAGHCNALTVDEKGRRLLPLWCNTLPRRVRGCCRRRRRLSPKRHIFFFMSGVGPRLCGTGGGSALLWEASHCVSGYETASQAFNPTADALTLYPPWCGIPHQDPEHVYLSSLGAPGIDIRVPLGYSEGREVVTRAFKRWGA